jgi:cyclase
MFICRTPSRCCVISKEKSMVSPALRYGSLCPLLALAMFIGNAQTILSAHFHIEQLAPGVFAAIATENGYAGANAGIVDLGDKTLVFDTFLSPTAARDLLRAAEQLTHHPVAYVVNSHFHNDHIRGNQVFGAGVDIISTVKTREAIRRVEPEQITWEVQNIPQLLINTRETLNEESDPSRTRDLAGQLAYYEAINESHAQLKTRLPNVTFENTVILNGASRTVHLLSPGGGHTSGDCILLLPDEHIAFVGDLVAVNMHPYMADGSPKEWVETLKALEALPIGTLVPGHGSVGYRADITAMIDYIHLLQHIVGNFIALGKEEDDIQSEPIPSQFRLLSHSQNFALNFTFLYDQMVAGEK